MPCTVENLFLNRLWEQQCWSAASFLATLLLCPNTERSFPGPGLKKKTLFWPRGWEPITGSDQTSQRHSTNQRPAVSNPKNLSEPACDSNAGLCLWSCALPLIWHFFSNLFYLHFCLYIFFLYGSLVLGIYLDEITETNIFYKTGWKALEIRLPLNLLAYLQSRTPSTTKNYS